MTPAMPPSPIRCHTFSSVIASYDLESDSQFTKTPATLSRSFSRFLAPRTGWQDQPDRRRHDPHHPAQFPHCGAQRRHEDDDVPEWPDEQAKPPGLRLHAHADTLGRRVGRLRLTVPYQFDPDDKAELANVADVRMLAERLQEAMERRDLGTELLQRALPRNDVQVGQRHGAAQRVARIAVTVEESLELLVAAEERPVDTLGRQRGGKGQIAAGHPLADRHEVRLHALVLAGEHPTRAAEAGGHFISDQQHPIA